MDKKQRIALIIITAIGLLLSIELTHIFIKANFGIGAAGSFCSINQVIDCVGVAQTSYSSFFGIPLSIWGLLLYSTIFFLLFVDKIQEKFKNTIFDVFKTPNSYIATLGIISFICSIILASISIFKIGKICYLCFITYFLDLIIACVAKTKGSFFIVDIKNTFADFIEGVKKYTLLFVIVVLCLTSLLYYTQTSMVLTPKQKELRESQEFREMRKNIYAVNGNILGNPNGIIKVYIYSDFMCPFCRITNIMVHKLAHMHKDIEVIHQNYPLDPSCNPNIKANIHPGSCILSQYAIAAEKQGNYWGMVNAIYDNMPQNEEAMLAMGKMIGLNAEKLKEDAYSDEVKNILSGQIELATSNNVNATPSMVISGILYPGTMSLSTMELRIKQAKKRYKRDMKK